MKLTYRSNDELMDLMTVALSGCRVCKTCKQKDSTAGDRVRYLSANLPGSMNATPIEEAIISGMKSETLAGCKTCATKQTPHEIQTQIVFPSEILIVQVNRYKKSGKLRDEIEVQGELAIPDSLLDDSVKARLLTSSMPSFISALTVKADTILRPSRAPLVNG